MATSNHPSTRPDDGELQLVERRARTRKPPLYRVLLHNDDYTTMEFVIRVLREIFGKGSGDAVRLMLEVHTSGQAIAGIYPRQVAETKAAEVIARAESEGMPLLATAEPEEEEIP